MTDADVLALQTALARVRALATRLRDFEGVPSPIGPLHGSGMVLAYQDAAKAIDAALAGTEHIPAPAEGGA